MNTLNRLIQLAKIAILANLIPPKEFGILGIGFLILAVFNSFSQLGINTALIQRSDKQVNEYLNTTWILQIVRGLILTTALFAIAPYAADLFGEPRATNVIRVLGIGPLLLGLKNPGVVYFRKNLQFHRRFLQILSGTTVNFCVAVGLGILWGNVWAFVAGAVAGNLTSLVASYLLHGYRPQPEFDINRASELIDYGKWIFGGGITTFLINQGDDFFVGWLLGATPLAFYQMAYRFSNAPATELTSVITNVVFPSLSQVQDDYGKLRDGYFRTLRFSTFLSFPAGIGIFVTAPVFVQAFLGAEWLSTVPIMQMLSLWGILRALGSNNGPVFYTLSRPDVGFKLNVVRIVLIAIFIYPASQQFELLGVAAVIVGTAVVVAPFHSYIALRLIDGSIIRYLRALIHPIIGSVIMGTTVWIVSRYSSFSSGLPEFMLLVIVGVLSYTAYTAIVVNLFNYPIKEEFETIFQSI